jgi:large subunit ribosomal protein L33
MAVARHKYGAVTERNIMAKKTKREYFWMECTSCGQRNYRTEVSTMGGIPKMELNKYCKHERKRTKHKLRKK